MSRFRYLGEANILGKLRGRQFDYGERLIQTVGLDYLLRYYPLQDLSGTVAIDKSKNQSNGSYTGSPTLAQSGILGTDKSVLFVANSYCNIYSAALAAGYNPEEMSFGFFIKPPNAAWWTDNTQHTLNYLRSNASNLRGINKTTGNLIQVANISGGTSKTVAGASFGFTNWMHLGFTISKSNDRARLHLDGYQYNVATGLGTYDPVALATTYAIIGNYNTGAGFASLAYQMHYYLATRELTGDEMEKIANPFSKPATRLFAIGDSKTNNFPGWPYYINQTFQNLGRWWVQKPAQYGAGGLTTAIAKAAIDAQLASRTDIPNYVIINLGANDVTAGDPGATWLTNTEYICAAIHAKYPFAPIYLTKIWCRNTGLQAAGIAAINGYIDTIVADPNYNYVHVGVNEADFLPGGDDGATMTSDGVHPNALGCAAWVSALQTVMGY